MLCVQTRAPGNVVLCHKYLFLVNPSFFVPGVLVGPPLCDSKLQKLIKVIRSKNASEYKMSPSVVLLVSRSQILQETCDTYRTMLAICFYIVKQIPWWDDPTNSCCLCNWIYAGYGLFIGSLLVKSTSHRDQQRHCSVFWVCVIIRIWN